MLQLKSEVVNTPSVPSERLTLVAGPSYDAEARLELAVSRVVRKALRESDLATIIDRAAAQLVAQMPPHALEEHALWDPSRDPEEEGPRSAVADVTTQGDAVVADLRAAAANGIEWALETEVSDLAERALMRSIRERLANVDLND